MSLVAQILVLFTFFWSFGWGAVELEAHAFKRKTLSLGPPQKDVVLRIGGQRFPRSTADCLEILGIQLFWRGRGDNEVFWSIALFLRCLLKMMKYHKTLGFGTLVIVDRKCSEIRKKWYFQQSFGHSDEVPSNWRLILKKIFVARTSPKWRRFMDWSAKVSKNDRC